MRTKLDEIVEEEFGFDDKCVRDAGKRIADRAFRHGVERGVATAPYMMDGRSYIVIVQTAPAEEKIVPHDCYCKDSGHSPGSRHNCYCHEGSHDRRKGLQRRKDERGQLHSFVWQRPEDTHSFGSIFKDDEAECWKLDRRRIKDRRKA